MTGNELREYLKANWDKPLSTILEETGRPYTMINYYARQLDLPYRKRRPWAKDVVGQRYGKLTILKRLNTNKVWVRCDCGTEFETWLISLKNGDTKSCGCLRREKNGKRDGVL